MSGIDVSENLNLIRKIFSSWEQGDFSEADWADPEIEYVMHGGLGSESVTGVAGMAAAWASMLQAWEHLRAVPEEIREIDEERVLALLRNEGRGKGSGIDIGGISVRSANIFTIRDGKVTRLVLYWDRGQALAELGLAKRD